MTKYTDLSIDLETLGTDPGCVITQIGLAAFNADDGIVPFNGRTELIYVDPQSCLDAGMHVSWSTIAWWLKQDDGARVMMADQNGAPLAVTLGRVSEFVVNYCTDDVRVWGNGATFDVALMEDAFRRAKMNPPWRFRQVRDMRTLVALCPTAPKHLPAILHKADEDAAAQARTIRECYSRIVSGLLAKEAA